MQAILNILNILLPLPLGIFIGVGITQFLYLKKTWIQAVMVVLITILVTPVFFLTFLTLNGEYNYPGRYGVGLLAMIFLPSAFALSFSTLLTKKMNQLSERGKLLVFIATHIFTLVLSATVILYIWGNFFYDISPQQ